MDEAKLHEFMGKFVTDMGGAYMMGMVPVLAENSTPIGRLYYAASSMVCIPNSLSQEVGLALGAQAGEPRLRELFAEAGFKRFRRATETPFNLILEACK